MSYNYKKANKEIIAPYSKQIDKHRKDFNLEQDGLLPYTNMLEDERKDNKDTNESGTIISEKQFDEARNPSTKNMVTEKQLDQGKSSYNAYRMISEPIFDYHKKTEEESRKAFKKDQNPTKKRYMDEIANQQKIGPVTKVIKNEQKSQLLSNYNSRNDFKKSNPDIKQASSLFDADAMIYHIYRKAAVENRGLSDMEKQAISDIENSKIKILAQWHEDFEDESNPVELNEINYEDEEYYEDEYEDKNDEEEKEYFEDGKRAFHEGLDKSDNPLPPDSLPHAQWDEGWQQEALKVLND